MVSIVKKHIQVGNIYIYERNKISSYIIYEFQFSNAKAIHKDSQKKTY